MLRILTTSARKSLISKIASSSQPLQRILPGFRPLVHGGADFHGKLFAGLQGATGFLFVGVRQIYRNACPRLDDDVMQPPP